MAGNRLIFNFEWTIPLITWHLDSDWITLHTSPRHVWRTTVTLKNAAINSWSSFRKYMCRFFCHSFWCPCILQMPMGRSLTADSAISGVCVCLCTYLCDTADKITNESLYPCVCPTPSYREKKHCGKQTGSDVTGLPRSISISTFATPPKLVSLSPSQSFLCQGPSLWPVTPSAEVNAHSSCCINLTHTRSHPCSSWTWTCPAAAHSDTDGPRCTVHTPTLNSCSHQSDSHLQIKFIFNNSK